MRLFANHVDPYIIENGAKATYQMLKMDAEKRCFMEKYVLILNFMPAI